MKVFGVIVTLSATFRSSSCQRAGGDNFTLRESKPGGHVGSGACVSPIVGLCVAPLHEFFLLAALSDSERPKTRFGHGLTNPAAFEKSEASAGFLLVSCRSTAAYRPSLLCRPVFLTQIVFTAVPYLM